MLGSVVVARVSLNRIGRGAECVVMGARNLSLISIRSHAVLANTFGLRERIGRWRGSDMRDDQGTLR